MATAPATTPAAPPGTPHRNNLAYQMILDNSPQTSFEEPAPSSPMKRRHTAQPKYPKQPALAAPGRSQQKEKGSQGQGPLDPLISELGIFAKGIKQLITEQEAAERPATWAAITSNPSKRSTNKPAEAKTNLQQKTDPLQVLIRVPKEYHEWARGQRNFALQEATCRTLGLLLAKIPDIHNTATGFSIRPANTTIRDKLITSQEQLQLCLRASKVELPIKWYNYTIPSCPTKLPNILRDLINTEETIEDEVIAQTGQRPIQLHPSRHTAQNMNTERKTWIASFLQPVESFRLFGISALARQIKKKALIQRHNPGCQGFHTNRYCYQ
ncbi:hypothetical protein S7711_10005 [Stachybotrys chartarum IBT 7711]|uniref:Uncharacterized protein n=1 Tax=Stachybotrys chartarum (strain CBS 109288 / IBT 7711) TaxID=1280523 RepID=A0A084B7W4_STACB|nr:hypothetical protein S7711_10005 [Stachybotrys chartarum IBT 7711]